MYNGSKGGVMMPIQRISDGKYRLWVSNGRGPDGKRLRYSRVVKAKDDKEAKKLLVKFEKEVLKDELPVPKRITFRQLWEIYMRDHVSLACAPKTYAWYEQLSKRVFPALGHYRVSAIQPAQISNFYALLKDENATIGGFKGGLAPSSIKHYERALRAVFNFGITYKIIKENPANSVKAPKVEHREQLAYDENSIQVMLDAIARETLKWQSLIVFDISTGLRRGEVAGIKWCDIDFKEHTVKIKRAVQYIAKKGLLIGDTKTPESKRIISLSDLAVALLLAWKEDQKINLLKRYDQLKCSKVLTTETIKYMDALKRRIDDLEDQYVWQQYDGQPIMPDSITTFWTRFRKKNELPNVTFHGLRHTLATISLAEGIDVKTLARQLGHSKTDVTLNTYAHAVEGASRKIANIWDRIFEKSAEWHTGGTQAKIRRY
jgi:integrase